MLISRNYVNLLKVTANKTHDVKSIDIVLRNNLEIKLCFIKRDGISEEQAGK